MWVILMALPLFVISTWHLIKRQCERRLAEDMASQSDDGGAGRIEIVEKQSRPPAVMLFPMPSSTRDDDDEHGGGWWRRAIAWIRGEDRRMTTAEMTGEIYISDGDEDPDLLDDRDR